MRRLTVVVVAIGLCASAGAALAELAEEDLTADVLATLSSCRTLLTLDSPADDEQGGEAEVESAEEGGMEGEGEGGDAEDEDTPQALTLIDCTNFRLLAKNVSQEDEDGDSSFGVGLDWRYGIDKSWDGPFTPSLSLSGEGFVSLGDVNGDRDEASETANFNSITNQLRVTAKGVYSPELEKAPPMPSNPADRKRWAEEQRTLVRRNALRQAQGYVALDFGLHARSESSQEFTDTQVALGAGATVSSGLISRWLFLPLSYLVPARDEYGAFVQSPLLFVAIDEVLGADHREAIDDADDDNLERFRLELAWTSELLTSGLYPFVHFQYFQELGAESEIKDADKDSSTFVEVGARYYIGSRFEGIRRRFGGGEGPFVAFKYATGRLPPYLEPANETSVGVGFEF
jgi:hypothetical protein